MKATRHLLAPLLIASVANPDLIGANTADAGAPTVKPDISVDPKQEPGRDNVNVTPAEPPYRFPSYHQRP